MLLQSEASGGVLADRILGLVRDGERRARLATSAHAMARPDAAKVIVDRVLQLVGRRDAGPETGD